MKKQKKTNYSKIEYVCDDREEGLKENRPIPPDLLKEIISDYQSSNSNYQKNIKRSMKQGYIPDPDFEGWDGRWVDDRPDLPRNDLHLAALARYMRENNKEFEDLTPEKIEQFRLKD